MIAAVASIAVRVAPVAVRIATNPKVISGAVQVVGLGLLNMGIRGIRLQGEDKVAQRQAEAIHSDTDQVSFADDPRKVVGIKARIRRNLTVAGMGAAEELRTYRHFLGAPIHLATWGQVKITQRHYARLVRKLPDNVLDEPTQIQTRLVRKINRTGNRLSKRAVRLERIRTWSETVRVTPGEQYLADVVETLKRQALTNEVRVDSVESLYTRSLEEKIDLSSVDFTNLRETGAALYVAVTTHFKGDEPKLIRSRVLKSWLARNGHSMTTNQWQKITQGWADAQRVAQTV